MKTIRTSPAGAARSPDSVMSKLRRTETRRGTASAAQSRRALWLCLVIGLIALACIPVATLPRSHHADFLAAYQTGLIAAYFISGYLLFALYRGTRAPALLFLCSGSLYAGAMLVLQLLSYPALAPAGLLPDGPRTTLWLWIFWHAALPLSIALYAVSEWLRPGWTTARPERMAAWHGAGLLALLGASIAAVVVRTGAMPDIGEVEQFARLSTMWLGPALLLNVVLALGLLWRATGFRTLLHIWLGVALVAMLFDHVMTLIGGTRLSVGWYVGQGDALISATVTLLLCMGEIDRAYVGTVNSVQRLATANALLEAKVDQAGLDHLTGLPGRALFMQRIRALRAHNLGKGMIVAVMVIDLDGFKRVNDTFGHERGDQVLKQTADVLRSVLRDTDVAARFGGDEFVVCLFAPFNAVQAVMIQIAGRIVAGVAELGNGIGCSVGVSLFSADRLGFECAMQQADEAMYLAKSQGKNRYAIYGQPYASVQRLSA